MKQLILFTALLAGTQLQAQNREQWSNSRIQHEINKLGQSATVLYIAAHPDDENTRLITWLANEKRFRTAYLSLTRGDGGQNLIGQELGEKLGIIRTHELMAARRIDGGEQYFTRAFDFGYSKSPEETFTKWNRDSVLADVVFVIRMLQPDIIITRFATGGYPTHGHHTASALLASEAFEAAADPQRFPEQFAYGVQAWSVKWLYFNASTWWNRQLPELARQNDSFFQVEVGGYNPLLGASYTEIAGRSRSMHKSQGFGAAEPAGEQYEYLKLIHSRQALRGRDPFQFEGNQYRDKNFIKYYNEIVENADFKNINGIMTSLVNIHQYFKTSHSSPLSSYRLKQVEEIMLQLCGLKMGVFVEKGEFAQGSSLEAKFSILNRSGISVRVKGISPERGIASLSGAFPESELPYNKVIDSLLQVRLAPDFYTTIPWLRNGITGGMFNNSWRDGGVMPGTDYTPAVLVKLEVQGVVFYYPVPITYSRVDPVKGEQHFSILVLPALEITNVIKPLLFAYSKHYSLVLRLKANTAYRGPLVIRSSGPFSFSKPLRENLELEADSSVSVTIPLYQLSSLPFQGYDNGEIEFKAHQNLQSRVLISYDHIGRMQYCQPVIFPLHSVAVQSGKARIAYLHGAGDEVDEGLRMIGYQVENIRPDQLRAEELARFDVLILGIRSYNTLEITDEQQKAILDFIHGGGNVIMQYCTNRGLKREDFAPYPLKLGRSRVTEEDAEMKFSDSAELVLNKPNQIIEPDFANWVQERGLYFADSYDSSFRSVFYCHDTGEADHHGILLIADYGSGSFIYTGISFFRQIPAGVPGAYRLLVNLIEYQPQVPANGTE